MAGMIMDAVLMLLLVAAVGYGIKLERKLAALRTGQIAFAQAVTELNAAAELAGGVARISLGGSRQGGEIKSGPDKGKKGPQRPDWTATFSLNYVRPITDDWDGFFNLKGNGRWGGVQEIAQTPELHDYQNLDVRAGVKKDGLELSVYSNNVGNESYIVFDAPTTRRWNLPRTYGAQVRYAW